MTLSTVARGACLCTQLGYEVIPCSASSRLGVDRLRDVLAAGTTALSGQSGVGKSSLLNVVQPGLNLRVGEVSAWTQLPGAMAGLFNLAASAFGVVLPPPLGVAVQVAATLWCVWLVYEALRAFSPRTLRGGVIAYVLFGVGSLALGFGLGVPGASRSPSGLVF